MHARRDGRKKLAVGRGAQSLARPRDADELFGFVVPRRHLVVSHGPVAAQAVERISFEIVVGKTERNTAVVIGASAQDARTEPLPLVILGDGIRFSRDLPVSVGRSEEVPLLASEVEFRSEERRIW